MKWGEPHGSEVMTPPGMKSCSSGGTGGGGSEAGGGGDDGGGGGGGGGGDGGGGEGGGEGGNVGTFDKPRMDDAAGIPFRLSGTGLNSLFTQMHGS